MSYGLVINSSAGAITIDGLRTPRIYGKVIHYIAPNTTGPVVQISNYPATWPSSSDNPSASFLYIQDEFVFTDGTVWSYEEWGTHYYWYLTLDNAARTLKTELQGNTPANLGIRRYFYFMSYGETS